MHTIIHRHNHSRFPNPESRRDFRSPHYDCMDLPSALKFTLYVPGVDASGVDITTSGPDLFVTARKTHHLRANWQALHLESVQRDYQLKLRLGSGFDFEALQASVTRGVLTIVLPKSRLALAGPARPTAPSGLTPEKACVRGPLLGRARRFFRFYRNHLEQSAVSRVLSVPRF